MAQTTSSGVWNGFLSGLAQTGVDAIRSRLIDVESVADDSPAPDYVADRTGDTGAQTTIAPAGVPLASWGVLAVAVVAGAYVLKRIF